MKQYIKSYHLFLSQHWIRLLIYLFYPVLYLGAFWFLRNRIMATPPASEAALERLFSLLFFILGNLIISLEIFVDSAIFGGIAEKDTNKLEYLKTSPKGMSGLKKALIADAVRRLASLIIITGGCGLLSASVYSWADTIAIILTLFSYIELGLMVTRRFSTLAVAIITASVIYTFLPVTIVLIQQATVSVKILLPAIIGTTVAVIARWLILWKARNSYYDNRNEKSI